MTIASRAAIFGSPAYEEKPVATVKTLKKKLDELGVEYASKATKAELEVLALNATRKAVPADRPARVAAEPARSDIKITCMVETMDGKVHEQVIRIVNPGGCIIGTKRNNPDYIYEVLRQGLASKLGANHIK
jgi:hypothetical protein